MIIVYKTGHSKPFGVAENIIDAKLYIKKILERYDWEKNMPVEDWWNTTGYNVKDVYSFEEIKVLTK